MKLSVSKYLEVGKDHEVSSCRATVGEAGFRLVGDPGLTLLRVHNADGNGGVDLEFINASEVSALIEVLNKLYAKMAKVSQTTFNFKEAQR